MPATGTTTRVLQLLVSTRPGGGPVHVFQTIRRLPPDEFTCIVGAPDDGAFFSRFAVLGETHAMPLGRLDARALGAVVRRIRASRVDVVHSHGKGAGLYGRLAARLTGTPAIHTFHGIHVEKHGIVGGRAYLALERVLSRLSFAIVNVSESQARLGESLALWPPGRAVLIPNGIDLDATRALAAHGDRATFGVPPGGPVIVCIARLDHVKAVDVFVRAAGRLVARHPSLRALVIGDGPDASRVRGVAESLGPRGAVVFAGEIPDAVRALGFARVLVSTSRGEGLPLSVLEALAVGVPVVVSRIPVHEELVVDGETGLLARVDDPGDVADTIDRLLDDDKLRSRVTAAGREVVERRYDVRTTAAALAALYRRARSRRPAAGAVV